MSSTRKNFQVSSVIFLNYISDKKKILHKIELNCDPVCVQPLNNKRSPKRDPSNTLNWSLQYYIRPYLSLILVFIYKHLPNKFKNMLIIKRITGGEGHWPLWRDEKTRITTQNGQKFETLKFCLKGITYFLTS